MPLELTYLLGKKFNDKADGQTNTAPQKRLIDKNAPIASLASGTNQFTVIADTDHRSSAIPNRLVAEMPQLAAAGVKHLMLEYFIHPIGHPLRNSGDEQMEDIFSRLNSRPPQITEPEIWDKAPLFKSYHEKGPTNETGKAYCNLLISAMKAGITVHLAGDENGLMEQLEAEEIYDEQQQFLKKYAKLERFSQKLDEDPDFIKNLNWPEKEKRALEARIYTHRDVFGKILDRWTEANERYEEERLGIDIEFKRAERFAKLANGEKAVVMFGQDHFNNKIDLNEAIDVVTKIDAFKRGKPVSGKTSVIEIYSDEQRYIELAEQQTFESDGRQIVAPNLRLFADSGEVEIPRSQQENFAFKPLPPSAPSTSTGPSMGGWN